MSAATKVGTEKPWRRSSDPSRSPQVSTARRQLCLFPECRLQLSRTRRQRPWPVQAIFRRSILNAMAKRHRLRWPSAEGHAITSYRMRCTESRLPHYWDTAGCGPCKTLTAHQRISSADKQRLSTIAQDHEGIVTVIAEVISMKFVSCKALNSADMGWTRSGQTNLTILFTGCSRVNAPATTNSSVVWRIWRRLLRAGSCIPGNTQAIEAGVTAPTARIFPAGYSSCACRTAIK